MSEARSDSLQDRILALLDGTLGDDELRELDAELKSSREARDLLRQLATLHSTLEEQGESKSQMGRALIPMERLLADQRRAMVRNSLLAAAAVLMISALALWVKMTPSSAVPIASLQVAPNSAFHLTHTGDDEAPMGSVLAEGSRLVLEHGVAELQLPHQVRAVVGAPAAITLIDESTLQLDHGRAYFRVSSEEGKGFTVVTPQQRIVDLGTAFGIDARSNRDEIELHVLEGEVRIDGLDGGPGEIIKAKRSVLLAGTRVKHELDGPPTAFRRNLPTKVDRLVKEDFETGLIVGQSYVIRADPTVIRDLAGNSFSGIDDNTTWAFTTAPPVADALALFLVDLSNKDGSAAGWDVFSSDVTDVAVTDQLGGDNDVTLSITGIRGNNNPDGAGATTVDGVTVPLEANDDYVWGANPGSILFEFKNLDAGSYNVSVFAGRTTDANQEGTIWVGAVGDEPAQNTGDFANSSSTPLVWIGAGDSLFYLHQEDNIGGTSGLIVKRVDPDAPLRLAIANKGANLDFEWNDLSGIQDDLVSSTDPDPTQGPGKRDDSPPVLIAVHPAADWTGGQLKMLFNEPIKFGSGRVFIQNVTDWTEDILIAGEQRMSIDDRVLTINPPTVLEDGAQKPGWLAGWESRGPVTLFNPSSDGTWYDSDDLQDDRPSRGMIGSMRSPGMVSINHTIRREIGTITADSRYTVSAAIGVCDGEAKKNVTFFGYTIRLTSGDTILAELSDNTPPGPPNSVTNVAFSWDSSTLPEGVEPGAPLAIEIAPKQSASLEPGYLDLDNVRVTVVGE